MQPEPHAPPTIPEPGGVKYRPPGWRIPEREKTGWITTIPLHQDGYCASEALGSQFKTKHQRMRMKVRMLRRRVTPRRLWTVVCAVAALISFARLGTLFLESWTAVRTERDADRRLLDLCMSRDAPTESAHMRGACLKAQRDRASPLLFKAVLRSVHTAWSEFYDAVGSPFKLGLVCLFLFSGLVMPLMPAVRVLGDAATAVSGDTFGVDMDPEENGDHVVVVRGGMASFGLGQMGATRRRTLPWLRAKRDDTDRIVELTQMEGGSPHEHAY